MYMTVDSSWLAVPSFSTNFKVAVLPPSLSWKSSTLRVWILSAVVLSKYISKSVMKSDWDWPEVKGNSQRSSIALGLSAAAAALNLVRKSASGSAVVAGVVAVVEGVVAVVVAVSAGLLPQEERIKARAKNRAVRRKIENMVNLV